MTNQINAKQVGAPDPEHKNSPITQEFDEEREFIKQEVPGNPVCYFNNEQFNNGDYVCSGDMLLRCDYGVWIQAGTCDPENL